MKKILIFAMAAALLAVGCSKSDGPKTYRATLTFEGAMWDALVDNPQQNGPLLYGGTGYSWYDEATDLYSALTNSWGDNMFWGGGIAISNYFSTDYEAKGSTSDQLTVCAEAAHSGKNCAVVNGYKSKWGDSRGYIEFRNVEGTVKSMWVCLTTYSKNSAVIGSSFVAPIADDDYIKVIATGYNASGAETGSAEIYLYEGKKCLEGWTKWDLSSLGTVKKICFDFAQGTVDADNFAHPAYFAFDDVEVSYTMPEAM